MLFKVTFLSSPSPQPKVFKDHFDFISYSLGGVKAFRPIFKASEFDFRADKFH